jgi:hypothetical protein
MNTKIKSLFVGVALALSSALVGQAQDGPSSSPRPATVTGEVFKAPEGQNSANKTNANPNFSTYSYSSYCVFRGYGSGIILQCPDSRITQYSKISTSISEYNLYPYQRFIGGARMTVHNVSPYNGGFYAWVDVDWGYPLDVRVDYLFEQY